LPEHLRAGILYSAANGGNASELIPLFYKQIICMAWNVLYDSHTFFHYKHIDKWALLIYIFTVILLISVHFVGKHVAGSTRWLALGPFTLQPSEFAKLGSPLCWREFIQKISPSTD